MSRKNINIPATRFAYGQRVMCRPVESESRPFEATITGIAFDFRRDKQPIFTLTEDDGQQSDFWTEDFLTPI